MRSARRLLLVLVATLVAAPSLAYTIFLKDGSQILAKQKYEVRGGKAIIVLPSGTETAIAVTEIDVARTDQANVQDLGTAVLIEDGKTKDLADAAPPPTARQKLGDLIRSGGAGVETGARQKVRDLLRTGAAGAPSGAEPGASGLPPRPKGFDEGAPVATTRPGLRDAVLAAQLKGFVGDRGLPVEVVQGASARRPLLVYETDAEGPVFRALLASAAALIEAQDKLPGAVDGVEVLCQTSDGGLAARFNLNPQQAAELLAGRAEITRFFVENVDF